MKKFLLSLFVAVVLLFGSIPAQADSQVTLETVEQAIVDCKLHLENAKKFLKLYEENFNSAIELYALHKSSNNTVQAQDHLKSVRKYLKYIKDISRNIGNFEITIANLEEQKKQFQK